MRPVGKAEPVPDGFVELDAPAVRRILLGVGVVNALTLIVEPDLDRAAVRAMGRRHDDARSFETDFRFGPGLVGIGEDPLERTPVDCVDSPVSGQLQPWVVHLDPLFRAAVVVKELDLRAKRFLDRHLEGFVDPPTTVPKRRCDRLFEVAGDDRVERIVGEGELLLGNGRDSRFVLLGDLVVAQNDTQNASRGGRIAIGVLAGAGRDLHRSLEVSLSVEEAQRNVGAIQLRVDVERHTGALRAGLAGSVLVFDQLPGGKPIHRVLVRPLQCVRDDLGVGAFFR